MTVTWFHSLPHGWVSRRIKTISPVMRGASPRPIDDPIYFDDDGEYAWVRISDVTASDGLLTSTTQRLSSLGASKSAKLDRGKLFLSIAGSVGKPCITDIKACIHDGFVYFPYLPLESQKFLYWIFEARECFSGLGKLGTQLNLNTESVGNIAIPFPDLAAQRQIADFLDRETARLDLLIEKKQRLVELLGEKWESVVENAISTVGKRTKLGHHIDILSGYAFPSGDFSTDPEDIPLLRGANVSPGAIRWGDTAYWSRERLDEVSRFLLSAGDVVLGMDRPWISSGIRVAELTKQDAPALLLQRVCRVAPRTTLDKQFMKLLLTSRKFLAYFEPIMTGVSVPHISPDQVSAFRFEYVERNEQVRRATEGGRERERIIRVQQSTEKSIDRLKEYRSALITAAVTGQIDVSSYAKSRTPDRHLDAIQEEMGA